jgi:hypothetical protein
VHAATCARVTDRLLTLIYFRAEPGPVHVTAVADAKEDTPSSGALMPAQSTIKSTIGFLRALVLTHSVVV